MLTNNWRAKLKYLLTGTNGEMLDENGSTLRYNDNFSVMKAKIGTGTTEEKATDYKLECEISSGYTAAININATNEYLTEGGILNVVVNVTNTSQEQLSFSELGLFGNGYSALFEYGMFAREVFKEPIVIPPGGGAVFRVRTCIENLVALLTSLFAKKGGVCYAD